jgi:hypothetical protein
MMHVILSEKRPQSEFPIASLRPASADLRVDYPRRRLVKSTLMFHFLESQCESSVEPRKRISTPTVPWK